MSFSLTRNRFLMNLLRLLALAVVVALSGVIAGMAVGVPLGKIKFATSKAVRLDQSRLAGSIDPEAAIATPADLPGWKAGDPAAAAFGILGSEFCGESVELPAALTEMKSSVFVSPSEDATLVTQAVRVEQWQAAREYVRNVDRVVSDCEKFFQTGLDGKRLRIDVKEGQREPPITDFVSRLFVAEDGSGIQSWSIMAVGDTIIGIRYISKSAPQHSFMSDLQNHILMRVAPQTFSPASGDTRAEVEGSDDGAGSVGGSSTTVVEGGAADESGDTVVETTAPEGPATTVEEDGKPAGDQPRD